MPDAILGSFLAYFPIFSPLDRRVSRIVYVDPMVLSGHRLSGFKLNKYTILITRPSLSLSLLDVFPKPSDSFPL